MSGPVTTEITFTHQTIQGWLADRGGIRAALAAGHDMAEDPAQITRRTAALKAEWITTKGGGVTIRCTFATELEAVEAKLRWDGQ
jgi:hypothetical protein